MGELVRLEVDGAVGTIRLDRPPMNAINGDLLRDLRDVADEAAMSDELRALVLYGGEKVFAAGADIKMMAGLSPAQIKPVITAMQDVFTAVERLPQVVIAAINGYCLGGGMELAMCADLRYAAAGATLGQPEIKLGIIPGAGGTQRLPRLVGPSRAKSIIYTGRFVKTEEAERIGLVDTVVPEGDDVYEAALEAARQLAEGPTVALRAAKVAINEGGRSDFGAGMVVEREAFADLFATEDQKEGMRAFVEKDQAKFTGR
ncbi:MAG TPA: enoyl-CoA hydratase-related protein [Actinomycetota bacterium]|nr:enoyl-CoA hydratase-related protein [Actinomycetota bacterium]